MTGSRDEAKDPSAAAAAMRLAQSIVESAPDAMVIVDDRGAIVLVNSQAEKLFGYPRSELLGEPIEKLVPLRLREEHRGRHRPGYVAGPTFRPMGSGRELFALRKDGTEFPVEISLSPIETDRGSLVSSTIRDVTERKRFEQALQSKNLELQNALLTKDRFLASMSHDLRTPLNAIIGFSGTLLMRLPGPLLPDQERQLKTVQTSGRQLLSLINNLLDLAKVSSGRIDLRFGPVDCAALLEGIVAELQPMAEDRGLSLKLEAEAPTPIETDAEALKQIVWNLVDNAIKFTGRGEVRVECRSAPSATGRGVEISVTDTGPGIPLEEQARVFGSIEPPDRPELYERAHGGGLGLQLSQKLASLLGSRITFVSQMGSGTTFRLRLPEARP